MQVLEPLSENGSLKKSQPYLPPRVMDICRCDARNLTDTQPAVVRDHHSNANRDFSGQTSQRSTGPDQVPRESSCRLRGLQLSR